MKEEILSQLRPINCELNILSRSDGSAMLTQGQTVCVASVYGPIEVKLQNLDIDKASIEVYYRPKSGLSCVADRLKEKIIRNTCQSALLSTLHPRTAISIQIQEMEDRGGLIACAINAAFLAILNSGLDLKYSIAAVHCVIDNDDQVVLDPSVNVCREAVGHLTFVFESINKSTVATHTDGRFTIGQYNDALMLARSASEAIFNFYRDIVQKFAAEL